MVLRIRSVWGEELCRFESQADVDVARGYQLTMRVPAIQDASFKQLRDQLENHVRRYGAALPDDLFPFLQFEAELVPDAADPR
jgi:hypothetical protein